VIATHDFGARRAPKRDLRSPTTSGPIPNLWFERLTAQQPRTLLEIANKSRVWADFEFRRVLLRASSKFNDSKSRSTLLAFGIPVADTGLRRENSCDDPIELACANCFATHDVPCSTLTCLGPADRSVQNFGSEWLAIQSPSRGKAA
jgi:hypothetical protein